MVDGRIHYQVLDSELQGYQELWNSFKNEFYAYMSKEAVKHSDDFMEVSKNYEIDPELSADIESIKGLKEGFKGSDPTTQYN